MKSLEQIVADNAAAQERHDALKTETLKPSTVKDATKKVIKKLTIPCDCKFR
jgi:hypothetical protein